MTPATGASRPNADTGRRTVDLDRRLPGADPGQQRRRAQRRQGLLRVRLRRHRRRRPALYVYDPDTGSWTALASAADTREEPATAFIDGKLYVTGGWGATATPTPRRRSTTRRRTPGRPAPPTRSRTPARASRCSAASCTSSAAAPRRVRHTDVKVYDPATDTLVDRPPAYPEPIAGSRCGAIGGKLYCAGGTTDAGTIDAHATPTTRRRDTWSPMADMPTDLWGSGYTAAERAAARLRRRRRRTTPSSPTRATPTTRPRHLDGAAELQQHRSTAAAAPAASTRSAAARAAAVAPPVASSEVLPGSRLWADRRRQLAVGEPDDADDRSRARAPRSP